MKATQNLFSLLAIAATVIAIGTDENNVAMKRGDANWTGGDDDPKIARRADRFDFCTPGKGECNSGGCWGCGGHQAICQGGPDSGKCCWRDGGAVSCVNV